MSCFARYINEIRQMRMENIAELSDTLEELCGQMGFTVDEFIGKSKEREISDFRFCVAGYFYHELKMPITVIAEVVHRDHSTVTYQKKQLDVSQVKKKYENFCKLAKNI